jgi:hypothetical protein
VEDEESCCNQACTGGGMVPAQVFTEVEEGEDGEDRQSDDLLNHLELSGAIPLSANTVSGHLKQVLEKGDAPTDQDHLPQCFLAEFQVSVPGKGHEDVGEDEQNNGPHSQI